MKICTKCKGEKELDEYYLKSGKPQSQCKECIRELRRIFATKNKDRLNKKRRDNKTDETRAKDREYYKNNRDHILKKNAKYRQRNLKKSREDVVKYHRKRRLSDPLFRTSCNMRHRIYMAFKKSRWNKTSKTQEMLGCNFKEAFSHIESQFTDGMNWENRSLWHIDHIKPLSLATTKEELIELCHYTNLQPLWAADNLRKSDKWEE